MRGICIAMVFVAGSGIACSSTPVLFEEDEDSGTAGGAGEGTGAQPESGGGGTAIDPRAVTGGSGAAGTADANGGSDLSTAGSTGSGGDGSSPGAPGDGCEPDQEGTVRCGATVGQREICENSQWLPTGSCPDGEVCNVTGGEVGCQPVAAVCEGKAGQPVCDGQGIMHFCDVDGVVSDSTPCENVELCRQGLDAGQCAQCIAASRRCEGPELQVCAADGSGFETQETCQTAALCNAQAGRCTAEACAAGDYFCNGNVLQTCNEDRTAFVDTESCILCDRQNGECDTCRAGDSACRGIVRYTCDGQGAAMREDPCPSSTPHCTGAEPDAICVECRQASDCTGDPGTCREFTCNRSRGECETVVDPDATCSVLFNPGVCTARGQCVECESDQDCGSEVCTNDGQCVECESDQDCGSGVCTNDARCVECEGDQDCGNNEACNAVLNECETSEGCGDGIIQPNLGEQCDDGGSTAFPDRCDNNCQSRDYFVGCAELATCGSDANGQCNPTNPEGTNFSLCFPRCRDNPCPELPGMPSGTPFTPTCLADSLCVIPCGSGDSCPFGMTCRNLVFFGFRACAG